MKKSRREELSFYLFAAPWLFGLLIFFAGPAIASFVLSLTDYNILSSPTYVGTDNFQFLFHDELFWKSLMNTLYMIVIALPITLIAQILLALFVNTERKGIGVFRTIYYLPYLVPAVATGILWGMLFNTDFGLLNNVLNWFGIPPQSWLSNPQLAKPSITIMLLWTTGSGMLIYLAGLKGIPKHLYESAIIDGATRRRQFWHITLPLLSPTIFFNLIMGIIGTFQMFTEAYVLTKGGPNYETTFYMYYLYNNAFKYFKMGIASAQAWILFLVILVFTLIVIRISRKWVYYEGEAGNKQ
ncbi:sugar ABC transporter permease [Paenibacillus albiflavus]|uniref:Sugar ABC transporter permease n=1 Tax=Paenibacillus albiflavus TaxID=2545760 RepID=A0A4R4EKI6_9BACL|nr:sugar ABC transporter permease [Paenibacillus albiflavus]TCZ78795.1 sugar ABC transporter permease [Paenibacillus albiflavus]